MEDKGAALIAADTSSNRNGHRALPAAVVLGLAMMLYAQFLAGVPMNSAIALPMMLGHIRANNCGHLLHSMQTPVALPVHPSLAKMSIPLEPGRIFFT